MADSETGRSGVAALVEALDVPRHARRGFAAGTLLAVGLFVFFVVVPDSGGSPVAYTALSVVFAVAAGLLVTGVLVAASAYRLAREL
jgi:uncharacterized membrane protein HdeD (DUF308 family)